MSATMTEQFEHINLNDVDTSMKPVNGNVYTLEINKLEPVYRTINKADSPFVGQSVLVLKGSYTIVEDNDYSGRKLWSDFWTPFHGAQVGLKKQMQATGVVQGENESLTDYAKRFETLSPPARFLVEVTKVPNRRDPEGPEVNEINFFTARPV